MKTSTRARCCGVYLSPLVSACSPVDENPAGGCGYLRARQQGLTVLKSQLHQDLPRRAGVCGAALPLNVARQSPVGACGGRRTSLPAPASKVNRFGGRLT
jgi:hypothetical protein